MASKEKVAQQASKAIIKLGNQTIRRKAIVETRDEIRSIRRGGHVRSLDGTVHN
jgi:hypothetical protein